MSIDKFHKYTSGEGSTVALGQHGSIFVNSDNQLAASVSHSRNGVYVALQFLELTSFTVLTSPEPARYMTTTQGSTGIGSDGEVVTGVSFGQGTIIFGRWNSFWINKGSCIAYCGP